MAKLTIIIPCLNEAETIQRVVIDAKKAANASGFRNAELIIADGGSTDGTLKILKKFRTVKVITVPLRGYGAAVHWGILSSTGDYIFYADADLSYPMSELRKFVPFIKKNYDLVLGSRIKGTIDKGAMPFLHRYLGTPILTMMIRWLYGIKTSDSNSGMRLVKKSFYKKLKMRDCGMEWSSELLIKTAIYHGNYAEVPIHLKKDARKRHPHLNTWADGWKNFKAIMLVRPESLLIPTSIFIILGVFYYNRSLPKSLYFLTFSTVLGLSFLVAKVLNYSIDSKLSRLVNFMLRLPIVILATTFTIISFCLLFIVKVPPEITLITTSISAIINMWVFFIEATKTHLINKLPDSLPH